jgi:oxidase EvaA
MTDLLLERRAIGNGFLRSALTAEGRFLSMDDVRDWFLRERGQQELRVERVPLTKMDQWAFDDTPLRFRHRSGKFFSIEGLHAETDFGPLRAWEQPIICQPEVGILGIITRVSEGVRYFLMQAKVEPGNVNGVQLSPTVQATRSNYTRVHGGTPTRYLEYFVERGRARVLVDQLQGEQGSRFLRKRNRNMIVEIDHDLPPDDRCCWLTLGQIKRLLRQNNVVNMDVRTVLSCVPLVDREVLPQASGGSFAWDEFDEPSGFAHELLLSVADRHSAVHTMDEILRWLTDLRSTYELRLDKRPLDALQGWTFSADEIRHESGRYFSVVGVDVETREREVRRWQQPLLKHDGFGLNGFVMQHVNGVLHLLVRACLYPGNCELFELGSTVSRSNADAHFGHPDAPPFLELFRDPPAEWVRYSAVQSEEGGRFYHYQNRYVLLELPPEHSVDVPESHCWMTLGQIQTLVSHGYFNIEGRNLLACIDLTTG